MPTKDNAGYEETKGDDTVVINLSPSTNKFEQALAATNSFNGFLAVRQLATTRAANKQCKLTIDSNNKKAHMIRLLRQLKHQLPILRHLKHSVDIDKAGLPWVAASFAIAGVGIGFGISLFLMSDEIGLAPAGQDLSKNLFIICPTTTLCFFLIFLCGIHRELKDALHFFQLRTKVRNALTELSEHSCLNGTVLSGQHIATTALMKNKLSCTMTNNARYLIPLTDQRIDRIINTRLEQLNTITDTYSTLRLHALT